MNPAARCQLCGNGGGADSAGMTQLTLGASARNTLSGAELRALPTAGLARYEAAIEACIKKIDGCAAADSADYDQLILQSCRAAGVQMQASDIAKKVNTKKDRTACESEIGLCMRTDNKCGADFMMCRANADFDRAFAECSTASGGCTEFNAAVRSANLSVRDTAVKNAAGLIANIVADYRAERVEKIAAANADCDAGAARDACVKSVCENNMKNKCAAGFTNEVSMANLLCKFHDTACSRLR
jgi:hypothetical protein